MIAVVWVRDSLGRSVKRLADDVLGDVTGMDDAAIGELARARRNELLAATDFYGLSDRIMDNSMRIYRQALRDIPEQDSFPRAIDWPEISGD